MSKLSQRHLLGIKNLTRQDIELIFETADNFKEVINRPIKKVPSLRDVTIANIFFENSTRTKLSFELAQKRLSADVISFSAAQSSVKKGETLIDTVNNILAMKVDMVVMRHAHPGAALFLSQNVKASIINAGDGSDWISGGAGNERSDDRERCDGMLAERSNHGWGPLVCVAGASRGRV